MTQATVGMWVQPVPPLQAAARGQAVITKVHDGEQFCTVRHMSPDAILPSRAPAPSRTRDHDSQKNRSDERTDQTQNFENWKAVSSTDQLVKGSVELVDQSPLTHAGSSSDASLSEARGGLEASATSEEEVASEDAAAQDKALAQRVATEMAAEEDPCLCNYAAGQYDEHHLVRTAHARV